MTLNKGVISSSHLLVRHVLSVGSGPNLDGSQLPELEDANSYDCYNVSGALGYSRPLAEIPYTVPYWEWADYSISPFICVLTWSKLIDNRTKAQTDLYTGRVMCKTFAFVF